jgi:SEC-C motif-containing protein
MLTLALTQPCPCGRLERKRALSYGQCCGPYLEQADQAAPTPQALMRSRYSAYVLERAPYLLATWHPDHRPADLTFEFGVKWLGLDVRAESLAGEGEAGNTAWVHFVARVRDASGRATRLEERSRFVREGGRWLYLEAQT